MPGGLSFLMFYTMFLHVTSETLHFTPQKYEAPNLVFCCSPFSFDSSTNPAQLFYIKNDDFSLFSLLHNVSLVSGLILAPLGLSWASGWLPGRLGGLRWTLLNHCKYHQSRAGASILHHVLLCYTLAPLGDPLQPL